MAEALSLSFFIYTLLLMFVCAFAASVELCLYLVTRGKAHLAFTVLFAGYLIEQGVVFAWGYSGVPDLSYETEGIVGATLLVIEIVVSTILVAAALWVILERVGMASKRSVLKPSLTLTLVQVVFALLIRNQTTYQWLFYVFRTIILLAMFVWTLVHDKSEESGASKQPADQKRVLWVVAILLVATACFDTLVFVFTDWLTGLPDNSFILYVCERNLCENVLVVFLAVRVVMRGASILALRFKEPPTGDYARDELRFERFAERYGLTPTERTVVMHLIENKKISAIAAELVVAEGTVKTHLSHIYKKAGCANRTELLQKFWE